MASSWSRRLESSWSRKLESLWWGLEVDESACTLSPAIKKPSKKVSLQRKLKATEGGSVIVEARVDGRWQLGQLKKRASEDFFFITLRWTQEPVRVHHSRIRPVGRLVARRSRPPSDVRVKKLTSEELLALEEDPEMLVSNSYVGSNAFGSDDDSNATSPNFEDRVGGNDKDQQSTGACSVASSNHFHSDDDNDSEATSPYWDPVDLDLDE